MAGKPSIFFGSAADRPTEKDSLGFQPYVESVAKFLESPNTQPPLVISIEGEWGSGKSSFMKQLRRCLAGPSRASRIVSAIEQAKSEQRSALAAAVRMIPSGLRGPSCIFVEFNAWRHDKEDALWAAFALTCARELKKAQPVPKRIRGWLKLLFSRLKGFTGWLQLSKLIVVAALWIALFVSVPVLLWLKGSAWIGFSIQQMVSTTDNNSPDGASEPSRLNANPTAPISSSPVSPNNAHRRATLNTGERTSPTSSSSKDKNPAENQKDSGGVAKLALLLALHGGTLGLWAAALLLGGSQLKKLGSPLETDLQKILSAPDYEGKAAFVESFHEDFSRILDAYCNNQRVYIFIDDLDRCEIPKAADLMQAINLMINEDPRLVFIIGMDREKVAASIVAKYSSILEYVDESRSPAAEAERLGFGYRFLEKFIQIQFKLPQPRASNLRLFAKDLGSRPSRSESPKLWKLLFEKPRSDEGVSFVEAGAGLKDEDASQSITINRLAVDVQINEDSDLMLEVIDMVAPVLNHNPRRLKQFLNLFRLSAFIANKLFLFDEIDGKPIMTFPQLAKFVAISMKWPVFIQELEHNKVLLSTLFKQSVTKGHPRQGWLDVSRFAYLMRYGVLDANHDAMPDADAYSLDRLDVDSLLAVTAPALRPQATTKQQVNSISPERAAQNIHSAVMELQTEPNIDENTVHESPRDASILDRVSRLAREYEFTRETMAASDERTAKMTALVRSARRIASTLSDTKYPLDLFFNGDSAGDRIVAIGIGQGCPPDAMYFPLALDGILNAKSAFEQYHALSLADALLHTIDPNQKNQLWAALNEQRGVVIDEKDQSRWSLRSKLLKKLRETMPAAASAAT